MFFDDEAFEAIVLGGNFFRVAGISSTYAAPPICRDDHVAEAVSTTPTQKELSLLDRYAHALAGVVDHAVPEGLSTSPRRTSACCTTLARATWCMVGIGAPALPPEYH